MFFADIIQLLYIDRGFFGKQAIFLKTLLKNSVEKPDLLSFVDATYKGYFMGNSLTELAPILKEAELSERKISDHVKSLYETKFKTIKTQKEHLIGKSYKDALFEEASRRIKNITQDNMADILATKLYNTIKDINDKISANQNTPSNKSVTSDELVAIRTLIGEIDKYFIDLQEIGASIYMSYHSTLPKKQSNIELKELENARKLFIEKNKELRRFYRAFPNLKEVFDHMIILSDAMDFKYGFFSKANVVTLTQNRDYENLLSEVWKALDV